LYTWSIEKVSEFWEEMWQFAEIKSSQHYQSVVQNIENFPPQTQWFPGSKLNFSENLLRHQGDNPALVFIGETKEDRITYQKLYDNVVRLATSLVNLGVTPEDCVVGYMPNLIETVIAMLAATAIGATWSSCGAELGAEAALDRLGQVNPKVLFTVDGYWYKGKTFDQIPKVKHLINGIQSLQKVIIHPFVNDTITPDVAKDVVTWNDFISTTRDPKFAFTQLPFNHPLYIMFSSGTTGKPKCMVQSAGGVLINHLKELLLHSDLKKEDRLLYITSPSWMMWNWLISGLATGATLILFDGNPLHPDWKTMWKIIQDHRVTIFGCSASYLHYLKSINAQPGKELDLSTLRQISQTGSALSAEGFEWVYQEIKSDLHYNSISGGTDINGCFAAGSPTLPVYAGELQARALGMKVEAYDENEKPIYNDQGELVCELPSPSMPIYFWQDKEGEKYSNAYFSYYPKKRVWRHGDYISINKKTGGVIFYGRSDAILKPSGVRIGTAEIYNIVEELDLVADSLAIGQQWENDQRIILFIQLSHSHELTDTLVQTIKQELRTKASPRHVPHLILTTPDIPYTFSGKKVESAVTNIIHGRRVTNRGALRNPESLDFYENILQDLKE
jgi:acetoacetyl-CoA synthetase